MALPPQQHIEILTKDPGEGWHTGIVSGQPRKGIFPSNYVKITRQGQAHTAGAASLPRYKGFLSKKSPKKGAGCVPQASKFRGIRAISSQCRVSLSSQVAAALVRPGGREADVLQRPECRGDVRAAGQGSLCACLRRSPARELVAITTHHKISAACAGLPRPQRSAGAVQDARQEDEPIGGADGDG